MQLIGTITAPHIQPVGVGRAFSTARLRFRDRSLVLHDWNAERLLEIPAGALVEVTGTEQTYRYQVDGQPRERTHFRVARVRILEQQLDLF